MLLVVVVAVNKCSAARVGMWGAARGGLNVDNVDNVHNVANVDNVVVNVGGADIVTTLREAWSGPAPAFPLVVTAR